MVVPSSFNSVTEEEWAEKNVSIVSYAKHMLRSAYLAMFETEKSILNNGRTLEAEENDFCMSIKEILDLFLGQTRVSY